MLIKAISTTEKKIPLTAEVRSLMNVPKDVQLFGTFKIITQELVSQIDEINSDEKLTTSERLMKLVNAYTVDLQAQYKGEKQQITVEDTDGDKYIGVEYFKIAPLVFINAVNDVFFPKAPTKK